MIGLNLIGVYHTVIETPYYNPLIPDPWWNELYIAHYVIKNSVKFLCGDKEIVVKEGQVMFGQRHKNPPVYLVDNGTQAEFLSFHFQIFNYPLPLFKPFDVPNAPNALASYKKILRYLNMYSALGVGSANATFMELFFQWLRRIHHSKTDKLPHHEEILEAQLYLNQHVEEKLSVSDIAKQYNFSEKHFRYLFNKLVGVSPKQYLDRVKLERAYSLLKTTDLTITEIADKLGFNSGQHLANAFKKAYRVSPSDCRKSHVDFIPIK